MANANTSTNMSSHFSMELVDTSKLIKVNNLKEISNPITFVRRGVPSPDGLLSNEIFGITKDERANTFAYIDLHEEFLHPFIYKTWGKLDSKIKECIHGTHKYIIDSKGELEEDDEHGQCGVAFLKKNLHLIKIRRTESNRRDRSVNALEKYMRRPEELFTKYCIVIPAYYRDVNTGKSYVALGEINELYRALLISVRALKQSSDYGFNLSDSTRGRIQETLVQIYDWFGSGTTINGDKTSTGLPGKFGVIRRAVMSKTVDYGSRLVMSAPQLKVEKIDDLEVDVDHSAVPLASVCTNFYPFIVFQVKRFFENELGGDMLIPYKAKGSPDIQYLHPKSYQSEFSETRIKKEIDRFLTGYSNRFIPIEVPVIESNVVGPNGKIYMQFKGYNTTAEEWNKNLNHVGELPIVERPLTWCDVLYIAAVEATKDKCILITRYPIDSYYNQFPTKVRVSSTKITEPMVINNTFYPRYPKIRREDIGKNTSNKFIDTMNLCNLHLDSIGGDYDGDQVSVKGCFSDETNQEEEKYMDSKAYLVDLGCNGVRQPGKEAIQSLYNLTLTVSSDVGKLGVPEF